MAEIQINGETGDSAPLRQGFPQGVVLSPLLFLLYIDQLRFVRPGAVKVALFADAVSVINSHNTKAAAEKEPQRVITAVAEWRISKKMVLNADKGEVTLFSTNSHEVNWQSTIIANHGSSLEERTPPTSGRVDTTKE